MGSIAREGGVSGCGVVPYVFLSTFSEKYTQPHLGQGCSSIWYAQHDTQKDVIKGKKKRREKVCRHGQAL